MDMSSHSKSISHQESDTKSCHASMTHSCCETSNDMDCCSEKADTSDKCCFNKDLLFKVKQEQTVPHTFILIAPLVDLEKDLTTIALSNSILSKDVYLVKHPPPPKEQKHVLYCSLILYA